MPIRSLCIALAALTLSACRAGADEPKFPPGARPFQELISLISTEYSFDVGQPPYDTTQLPYERIMASLQWLRPGDDPLLKQAKATLIESRAKAIKTFVGRAAQAGVAARLGDLFEERAGQEGFHVNPRTGRLEPPDISMEIGAKFMTAVSKMQRDVALGAAYHDMNCGIDAVLASVVADAGKYYPATDAVPEVIRLTINVPPNFDQVQPDSFTAKNLTETRLTQVLLSVDLVHIKTAPNVSVHQCFFIPEIKPGQTVFLSNRCAIPDAAPVNKSVQSALGQYHNSWMNHMGGVVEARCTLWSAECHQPARTIRFPGQAKLAAEHCAALAIHNLQNEMWRPMADARNKKMTPGLARQPKVAAIVIPPALVGVETGYDLPVPLKSAGVSDTLARNLMTLVTELAGADEKLVADAKLFIADPQEAICRQRREALRVAIARLAPKQEFTGNPVVQGNILPAGVVAKEKPSPHAIRFVINKINADGSQIEAPLTSTEAASQGQTMSGHVVFDGRMHHHNFVLWLNAAPAAIPVARKVAVGPVGPADPRRFTWVRLHIGEDTLEGTVGGPSMILEGSLKRQ